MRTTTATNCQQCSNAFKVVPSEIKRGGGKYCSRVCYVKSLKGHEVSDETRKKIGAGRLGDKNWVKRPEVRAKISATLTGRDLGGHRQPCVTCGVVFRCNPSSGKVNCSKSCSSKYQSVTRSGSKSPSWKGGLTPSYLKDRRGLKYKNWRIAVFTRDNYTCQMCGQVGGKLQADHVMPFAFYPDIRFEVLNGQTLCVGCHKKTPSFMSKVDFLTV